MKFIKFRNKGQTLIEVLIAIAIGTIIIAAVLGLATRSNRNANFSRNAEQASDLSQQGLEIIRVIKNEDADDSVIGDTSSFGCNGSPGGCSWFDLYSEDIPDTVLPSYNFILVEPGGPGCNIATWCLSYDDTSSEDITSGNAAFSRVVNISDTGNACIGDLDYTEIKQVTVLVTWADPSGSHESSVTSCLSNI